MKTLEKTYKIELNVDEIETIVNALHGEYKFCKDTPAEDMEQSKRLYKRAQEAKTLRNELAELVNRRFMGADA